MPYLRNDARSGCSSPFPFVGNPLAVENAERLDELEGDTAGNAAHVGRRAQS